jgi:hypothetical protein
LKLGYPAGFAERRLYDEMSAGRLSKGLFVRPEQIYHGDGRNGAWIDLTGEPSVHDVVCTG